MNYAVTSLGSAPHAVWSCLSCPEKRRRRYGQEHGQFRETAAAHIRETGHTLSLIRGTDELLTGLATELPLASPPKAITARPA